jgi:hypothetical protein
MACIHRFRSAFAPSSIELLDDEPERVALDRLHVLDELRGRRVHGLRHLGRDGEVVHDDLDAREEQMTLSSFSVGNRFRM